MGIQTHPIARLLRGTTASLVNRWRKRSEFDVIRVGCLANEALEPSDARAIVSVFRPEVFVGRYRKPIRIVIEVRSGRRDVDGLTELASDLVRLNVDVIVALGLEAARAAQTATMNSSIVVAAFVNAMNGLFVPSALPETNLTEVGLFAPEALPKLVVLAPLRIRQEP